MDQTTLKNIYNPFYTTKPTGTGLGLSIVYQIIREHGGQITVESEINKGTFFIILLPHISSIQIQILINQEKFIRRLC